MTDNEIVKALKECEKVRAKVLNDLNELRILVFNNVAKAETEAVKEFAERLRKKLIDGGLYPVFVKNKIAETEKEMVGGTE